MEETEILAVALRWRLHLVQVQVLAVLGTLPQLVALLVPALVVGMLPFVVGGNQHSVTVR